MRTLKVTFGVVSVSNPDASSDVIRYYSDIPEAIFDVIHDYLMLWNDVTGKGVGYVTLKITPSEGVFHKRSLERIRNIITDGILAHGNGEIPMTDLQLSLLIDRLNSARKKK